MSELMRNRVYGLMLIDVRMSNFNADWSGNPKMVNDTMHASPFAPKFAMRKYWGNKGLDVFAVKTFTPGMERVLTLGEKFEDVSGRKPSKCSQNEVVLELFRHQDIICFGTVFAEDKKSAHITGAVQLMEGVNVYKDTEVIRNEVLSPYSNSNKENVKQATAGTRVIVDEAHYLFDFSVDFNSYDKEVKSVDGFDGLTKEAYVNFKDAALNAVTDQNSLSKKGAENEMTLFVNCKDEALPAMGNLSKYVSFSKSKRTGIVDFSVLQKYLEKFKSSIESIEIYYNEFTTEVIWDNEILSAKRFSILDQEEMI